AAHGIKTALEHNPNVEFVEINRPLHLPAAPEDSPLPPLTGGFLPASKIADGDCESDVGVIPSDPFFAPAAGDCDPTKYQWGSYAMRLPEAWQYVRGHAKVLVIDTGLQTDHPDLKAFGVAGPYSDAFIGGNFRPHLSYNYIRTRCEVGEPDPDDDQQYAVHGTHTSGIVAATPNNGEGVAGACWHCPLVMASFNNDKTADGTMEVAARSLTEGADKGVQVGTMSFGVSEKCPDPSGAGSMAVCLALGNYANRQIAFTAASGNDLAEVELPGSHTDVVAVGAIATDGTHWDRRNRPEDCPFDDNIPPQDPQDLVECGSNYSLDSEEETLDLVAPGQFVLSTVFTGEGYYGVPDVDPDPSTDLGCGDQYPLDDDDGNDADGYGSCTGTSMSSPYVAGALG
ncbi:MAG: S8 family serine peptidase, partial [Actinomycetia bacterium]|nr:S8 family serine peptidase [Actinomycetes bacterium]